MENIISSKNKLLLNILNFFCRIFCTKKAAKVDCKITDCKNIILICYSLLGDAVMLLPMIRALHNQVPDADITIVCDESSAAIFKRQDFQIRIISSKLNTLLSSPVAVIKNWKNINRLLMEINEYTYDIAIEPRGDLRFILLMSKIHAANKVSFDTTGGSYLLSKVITPCKEFHHLIDCEFHILEELGISLGISYRIPMLQRSARDISYINEFFYRHQLAKDSYLIGIHPGASRSIKQWYYFDKLIIRLYKHDSRQIFLIFEGPNEETIVENLTAKLKSCKIPYIIVKENLDHYIAIISCCNQIICNDSGAGHIAAAYNIPVTVIFGPTSPDIGVPYSCNQVDIVSHSFPCKPCYRKTCKIKTHDCMSTISADEVYEKCKKGRYWNREYINL